MGSPSKRGPRKMRRVVVRTIVTLAVAAGAVLALAPAAHAEESFTVQGTPGDIQGSCRGLGGALFVSNDGTLAACLYEGGDIICDFDKEGENCTVTVEKKAAALAEQMPELRDQGSRDEHSVPGPKEWRQKVSVAGLRDFVCTGLGGEFVASDDGTFGACATATATIVCNDEERGKSGKNCTGVADKKKHAVSTRKRIRALLDASAVSPPSGTNQGGSPTNTTPTTTSPPSTTTTSPTSTSTTTTTVSP